MKKFRPPLTDYEIKELKRLSELDFSTFSEADVREEFLVEILKLLGYRKELDYSVSREESFKLNPLFLSVGSSRIKLDYLCSLRKQYFWIIDAKEGKCKDMENPPAIAKNDIGQTHFYSLHPEINCQYFIVSNGWFTNLYERDSLDDLSTPILSIKNTEIATRFLELDSYVGSTQLLPLLKEKLLDQIDKIFASEIRVERLDEFISAVRDKAGKQRHKVEQAARDNYTKNATDADRYKILDTEDISTVVYSVFQSLRTRFEIEGVARRLTERLIKNRKENAFKEYSFFNNLMLTKAFPVNFWYYPSVLHFLFYANKHGISSVHFGFRTIKDLLKEWLDLCLFHLCDKKGLRYMWACERVYAKIIKQSIIMMPTLRESVEKMLDKELFYLPEEKLAPLGPNQASVVINAVETSISFFRSKFIRNYYNADGYVFKENLADIEYHSLLQTSKEFDEKFGNKYELSKKELGNNWSDLQFYEYINHDRMGSAICDILLWNEDQLDILTEGQKQRIKLMAELDCTNFADDLCKVIGIKYNDSAEIKDREKMIQNFFNPSINQHI